MDFCLTKKVRNFYAVSVNVIVVIYSNLLHVKHVLNGQDVASLVQV
jgi:hypothetical protein